MPATDFDLRVWARRGTRHRCPDCEYEMFPIDAYRDACRYCGQIEGNYQRSVAAVAKEFDATVTWVVSDRADR